MQKDFIPKLITELTGGCCRSYVLLDDVFRADACISWAKEHKLDIKFICGTYTCATEILCKIQEAGYNINFVRRMLAPDIHVDVFDTVYCYYSEV